MLGGIMAPMEPTITSQPNHGREASTARVGATDFFLHLGFIASLYAFLGAFASFAFAVINSAFPDRQNAFYDPYATGMRFSVSMLIVVAPLMLFLLKKIYSHLSAHPEKKALWVRRWGLYLTLTLAIVALAIDLIVLINTYLGGEITARFALKALTVLVLGVLVWLFTRREIGDTLADSPKVAKRIGWTVIGVIIASLATGFSYIGSPSLLRDIRDDNQRETDLQSIKYQVLNYYQSKNSRLPQTLDEMLLGDPYGQVIPKDPATEQPYEYKILPDRIVTSTSTVPGKKPLVAKYPTFALCATFAEDGSIDKRVQDAGGKGIATMPAIGYDSSYPYYPENQDFSDHPAGSKCFEVSIDPERYPPFSSVPMPVDAKGI